MNHLPLIIKREYLTKVKNKSFIVMTFLSPLLFVGIGVFVGYLSQMKANLKTIAIHDETGRFVTEFKRSIVIISQMCGNRLYPIKYKRFWLIISGYTHVFVIIFVFF